MLMSVKTAGDAKILEFEGKLDTQTSPHAQRELTRLVEEGARKILVDFDKLDYVSSAGLRVLLTTAKQLKAENGELRICCLNELVSDVFDISGFITIFKVFASASEALEDF